MRGSVWAQDQVRWVCPEGSAKGYYSNISKSWYFTCKRTIDKLDFYPRLQPHPIPSGPPFSKTTGDTETSKDGVWIAPTLLLTFCSYSKQHTRQISQREASTKLTLIPKVRERRANQRRKESERLWGSAWGLELEGVTSAPAPGENSQSWWLGKALMRLGAWALPRKPKQVPPGFS